MLPSLRLDVPRSMSRAPRSRYNLGFGVWVLAHRRMYRVEPFLPRSIPKIDRDRLPVHLFMVGFTDCQTCGMRSRAGLEKERREKREERRERGRQRVR
jgi:hypothetical protein